MLTLASIGSLYDRAIVDTGRQPEFLFFVAFLVTFGFIRTSAHMIRAQVRWWPGNVEVGGTHIHHLVWGIVTLMITGYIGVTIAPPSPWHEIIAVFFGIGMGLALDEFALWLDLKDVYWSEQGRDSIDAVLVATLAAGLVVIGVQPFDLDQAGAAVGTMAGIAVVAVLAAITFLKGRIVLGVIAIFVPVVGIVTAIRLGRPDSPWARWRYRGRRADRLERARRRHASDRRLGMIGQRLRDAIGGAPNVD